MKQPKEVKIKCWAVVNMRTGAVQKDAMDGHYEWYLIGRNKKRAQRFLSRIHTAFSTIEPKVVPATITIKLEK